MTNENQVMHEKIEMKMLTALLAIFESPQAVDLAKLKAFYGFKVDEQTQEAAMKRNEIAERKLAGVNEGREFSAEETTEGIQAMFGKGKIQ